MTPTLVQSHLPHAGAAPRVDLGARARDWAEIQERMLVPLYEAVYERLDVGNGTRLLGLGCGSGLALLMAASRGAAVTGVDPSQPERLALARERLLPDSTGDARARAAARLVEGGPADAADPGLPTYNLVTAFQPIGCRAGDSEGLSDLLEAATPLAGHGTPVVLAGWGPPERCATSSVLKVATKLADPLRSAGSWRPALRDDLEMVAERAGLKPDGSGRVACPFGYADVESAARGLLSTGLFDAAARATDQAQVDKELTEALHPHRRADGTVWMPNVFRYLIARTP
ncbi:MULTISPECIES: SAM-dependent methyltransferase [Streptomyces]|uniref:SAM-dependent methyltransferase n=1 Tax=Streptomyces venezuelae TaxID=54571 RepID=A0A5P2BH19_STRVZ|nr:MULTISPECIES: SAM-dependent methyltransferase [Streptomyces]NEA03112.1 SAM-dependent methyltransferase [Streptomyces sp. SID10116]MYY80374.1 SAM-dependent methyltransferase [Streptomyces sp. SID335]MYZ17916.1 SAM-dependent methyltransferase [Streptomyces sp. SID337]NDZ88851.1 SAM-dependent methyltransferase [Streptomyces sp. SID10115]NEB46223.1 SAM-dependent methyltransferase [Streptomyces sp. SID339]